MLRYERFRHEVLHQRGFHLCIDTVTADDIRDFKLWMQEEHKYVDMYPVFYRNEVRRNVEQKRSENSMSGSLYRIRTVIKWCVKRGLTRNNPFDQYQIARPMYGDPFYLTLEERDKVYYADLSGMGNNLSGRRRRRWNMPIQCACRSTRRRWTYWNATRIWRTPCSPGSRTSAITKR